MGCAHASKILTNDDIEFIAKNTALSKDQVESRYQNFLKMHPDGRISRKSFHTMMKECYPGADTEKLERHIFRMYDSNKVSHGPEPQDGDNRRQETDNRQIKFQLESQSPRSQFF